jgi:hypothetical protein
MMNEKSHTGRLARAGIAAVIAFSLLIAGSVKGGVVGVAEAATQNVSVKAVTLSGSALSMWTTITKNGVTTTGFTPLSLTIDTSSTNTVTVSDYNEYVFDHWENGSTNRARTIASGDTAITAYYRTGSTNVLTVKSVDLSGKEITGMYTVIKAGSTIAKTGFTPVAYSGTSGTYTVAVSNYGSNTFDHWENGSTGSSRTLTLGSAITVTAFYKTGTVISDPGSTNTLLPKTGVVVALYMYPSGTGATWWQKVIDTKNAHPSVPMVATFNPNSGPGSFKDANIANWVTKLRQAGVIAIGYTYDNYGARSLTDLKADADKYKNWYNADGIFIDEFTNKVGYETHYSSLTSYAKSIGMKMTFGNPGTDVPKSYVGTVDVINITEGSGYMPISWLQYCVLCTSSGWHYQYDKRYFAYIRYGITSLDTAFETESAKWVGLLYLTDGTDSNGRWFNLPSYFGTEVATLDR